MAEKTDAGEADSTTKDVSVGGVWSAGVAALLSVYPLVFCCVHQFLYPCLEVLIQYTSPPRAVVLFLDQSAAGPYQDAVRRHVSHETSSYRSRGRPVVLFLDPSSP